MCGGSVSFLSPGKWIEEGANLIENVGDFVGDAIETVGDVAENILKNPLPVIQTIALTAALGPGGLALAPR